MCQCNHRELLWVKPQGKCTDISPYSYSLVIIQGLSCKHCGGRKCVLSDFGTFHAIPPTYCKQYYSMHGQWIIMLMVSLSRGITWLSFDIIYITKKCIKLKINPRKLFMQDFFLLWLHVIYSTLFYRVIQFELSYPGALLMCPLFALLKWQALYSLQYLRKFPWFSVGLHR